ncbi:MAG TPA: ADP-ribosylglycohydrolase family protein [Nocardioides sp.]|nr:ADP-ribosylglycohydrolase family protein [Nocardioides sp.]
MHDVLDLRDLVPDEAEQLTISGYPTGDLPAEAQEAAANGDLDRLTDIGLRLAQLQRRDDWEHDEPEDEQRLLAIASRADRLEPDASSLADRIHGAWLGRAVGNTLGKPVEGLTRAQVDTYVRATGADRLTGYLPLLDPLPDGVPALHPSAPVATAGSFADVPRDDDIDWTILGLLALETHGRALDTNHLATLWLDRVPFTQTYTAERAAYRNLVHGIRPPATATVRNPYREWIGALIRADVFGYVSPGDPAEAVRLALVDARLSHTTNGVYGEMWAAALVAAALVVEDAEQALAVARAVVPDRSRLGAALDAVTALHQRGADRSAALDLVDAELGAYPWVHTVNNAALIVVGLLWGTDFLDAVGLTIAGGRDTDSNGATVGSVLGALSGPDGVPPDLVGTTHDRVRSAIRGFDGIRIGELAERTARIATGARR